MATLFEALAEGAGFGLHYQEWVAPRDGGYRLVSAGAGQGSVPIQAGARIEGTFELTEGEKLYILVGQLPADNPTRAWSGCGGTFVAREAENSEYTLPDGTRVELLMAAGGAGGFSEDTTGAAALNVPGQAGTKGGDSSEVASGGEDGQGGTQGGSCYAQSGAGFIGDGDGCDNNGDNALAFLNGATGGSGGSSSEGGYGGGSTGRNNERLGGAGGYSGGASQGGSTGYGGGGGSYNAGTDQENFGGETDQGNFGGGWLTIEAAAEIVSVSGQATDVDGNPVDTVFLHIWDTKELGSSVEPDGFGNWTVEIPEGVYSVSYFKAGYQPITHGPYTIEPEP